MPFLEEYLDYFSRMYNITHDFLSKHVTEFWNIFYRYNQEYIFHGSLHIKCDKIRRCSLFLRLKDTLKQFTLEEC